MPATTYQVTKTPQIRAPGRLVPVRRQVKVAMMAAIASSGTNWLAMMADSGTKRIGQRLEQLSGQPQYAVLRAQQYDEAERQREDVGEIERAAPRTHGAEIPVQRDEVEHQELLGAHQFERDDPEPEVDLEGKIGQPQCGIADDLRMRRAQAGLANPC